MELARIPNPPTAHGAVHSFVFFPGRTTFVNTLCGKKVLHAKEADDAASAHLEEGVRIKPVTVGEQSTLRWPISVNLTQIRARAGRGRHTYIFDHC